ncbi:MAG: TonB-dependent receptor, partial [Bacteroidia bacterium]|nr:TonB-dependent receptor [Bacteroidia bacterium]
MKRKFLFCGVLFILTISPFEELSSQTKNEKYDKLDSVVVEAFRAGKNTPVTHSSLTKENLQKSSAVQSIPMLLSTMPSV